MSKRNTKSSVSADKANGFLNRRSPVRIGPGSPKTSSIRRVNQFGAARAAAAKSALVRTILDFGYSHKAAAEYVARLYRVSRSGVSADVADTIIEGMVCELLATAPGPDHVFPAVLQ